MKYIPEPYQRKGAIELLKNPKFGLLFDPGLGKTATVLHCLKALSLTRDNFKALIIAPRLVCLDVWPDEIDKWNPFRSLSRVQLRNLDQFEFGKTIRHINKRPENIWLTAPDLSRLTDLFSALVRSISREHGIPFRNFDYWLTKGSYQRKKFYETIKANPSIWPFNVLIVDESSKFKNASSKRFKVLRKFIPYFPRRIIMTGTFAPNGLEDIFSQQYIIDNGKTFGKQVTTFRDQYFQIDNPRYFSYKIKGPGEAQEIQEKVSSWVMRLDAADHLNLPELIHNPIRISLSEKDQGHYDNVESKLFTELDTGEDLIAPSSSVKYLLCRQMASGSYYDPGRPDKKIKTVTPFHKRKTERLAELIEELHGKPLIVAYVYRSDLIQIQKDLKKKLPSIGGHTSEKRAQAYLAQWSKGKIPVLLVQASSVAHGVNKLIGGNDLCFYTLTDHLEDYEQLIRRLLRRGAKGTIRVHYLIMRDTLDVVAYQRTKRKEKTERDLLKAIERYRKDKGK